MFPYVIFTNSREDNITIDHGYVGFDNVDCIQRSQDRVQYRSLVNMEIRFVFHKRRGICSDSQLLKEYFPSQSAIRYNRLEIFLQHTRGLSCRSRALRRSCIYVCRSYKCLMHFRQPNEETSGDVSSLCPVMTEKKRLKYRNGLVVT